MPRKGHSPQQVLKKLRKVEVAVAGGKSVGQAVQEIGGEEIMVESTSIRQKD